MRVSQRLDYAVRALTELARLRAGDTVTVGDLADRLALPRRFIEQQVTLLARRGIVKSRRGPKGGCALAKDASSISLAEVVSAIQGDVLDVPAVAGSAVTEMWKGASGALEAYFEATTLADLAERQRILEQRRLPMYYI